MSTIWFNNFQAARRRFVRRRMLAADWQCPALVTSIDRQHSLVERILDTPMASPAPTAKLHFADTGLEFVVHYPVEIQHSPEIDDEITRKLMEVIGSDAELEAAVSGSPKLRAAIKA